MDDFQLLQAYARDGSQEAFAELMRRHLDWVYQASRRQVGDTALAEDVTQAVFFTLARKAGKLRASTSISGWLFITARYASASALRLARRRQRHETQAAQMRNQITQVQPENPMADQLDAALAKLKSTDREALILRFFRELSHESIGQTLGITHLAAQKRVTRALDRLRRKLPPPRAPATDETSALSSIAAVLSEYAAQKAPDDLPARSLLELKTGPSAGTQAILKGMSHMRRILGFKIAAATAGFGLLAGITAVIALDVSPPPPPTQNLPNYDLSKVQVIQTSGQVNDLNFVNYYSVNAAVHQTSAANWSSTHFILGDKEWDVHEGGNLILKKTPKQPASADWQGVEKQVNSLQGAKCTREPGMDQAVNGVMCQAYHLLDAPGQSQNTYVFEEPATHRPSLVRSENPPSEITIKYDPPLPEDFFKVPAVAGAQTVDSLDYFQKKYPLDGAVYQKEGIGQIFSVQQAVEDANGWYHIVCSCRPTPAVRAALKDGPDDEALGKFKMDDSAGLPYHFIKLYEITESGMEVMYLLAIPQKPRAQDDVCQLPVTMASSDKILKSGHAARGPGRGSDVHIQINLSLQKQPDAPTAEQFAANAYDDIAPLVGMVAGGWIYGPMPGAGIDTKPDSLAALKRELDPLRPDAPASEP